MYSEDVWSLIHKVLDNHNSEDEDKEAEGSELDGFLVKVPEILDKFPESFLPDPYEDDVKKKIEFL
ncbi:Ataxia telangiectasia and Rad3 related, partial [Caligus rogercresseyi]